jgi:invasion protein IalB
MKRALMLFSLIATVLAFGGSPLKAANDPRATQLTYEPWKKFCFGNSTCLVGTEARAACFPSGGSLAIIVTGDKNASLSASFGAKRMLEGAISVQVDEDAPILIPHPECDNLGCRGKFEIDSGFIEHLRRSQTITIEAMDTANQRLSLSFSLADLVKAYDGPPIEPKVFEETQEKLQEELARREKEQKALQCQE